MTNIEKLVYGLELCEVDTLRNYTLEELANSLGLKLSDFNSLNDLTDKIIANCFYIMLHDENLKKYPILKHFHTEVGHFFAIALQDEACCSHGSTSYPVYTCLFVGDKGYGLMPFINTGNSEVAPSEEYQIIADILPLIEWRV